MDYFWTVLFLALWSYIWYRLGFSQALVNELNKDVKRINREIEDYKKEKRDNNEENIH